MRRILLILLSLWSLGQLSAQFSFSNRTSLLSDPTVRSGAAMAVADMNGDGLDDIIRLDLTSTLKIDYQTTPNSNFIGFTYGTLAGTQWSICIADVDRNGYNDIFTGGYYNGLKFLRANSSGSNYSLTTLSIPSIFLQDSNFVDINNDGHVDVFACNDDGISVAFRNNGSGGFMADTSLIYPQSTVPSNNSGNYGSVWIDYNNDRNLDLYISKCRFGVNDPLDGRRLNLLFQNDGNNKFTDVAEAAGLRPLAQSWATDFADIDNDGDLDAFIIVHDGPCLLYLNNGFGGFTEITAQSGISDALAAAGPGIQARFADFDNDGWVDLLFTSQGSAHCLFRNNGNNTFTNFPNAFPTDGLRIHSAATGDLNNDGFIDVIAGFANGYNNPSANSDRLFMNNGNGNNFFKVHLQGMASNPNGIGARLEIYGLWGIQIREVRSGESYGIMNSMTQHFGLADYPYIDSLVVRWPSGVIDKVVFPPINQTYTLQEGSFCQAFVDFNATINGQEVTFSDESGIGADQWLWTFGDGASSTLPNPTHTYSTNGLFEVCLQASGLCGDGQICQTINVNCQAPQAVFGSQADGLTVAFQDQSLFSPNQWFWTFGDATASTEQNPVHVFENPGTYFICLIVTGPCGSSQVCDFITVGCNDVEASFTSEINELNVQFTDNSTGGVSQWNWNFGDGQTSAQQDPLHIFAAPGQYLVCLQVTGPCGTETTCENITVSCPPPSAAFSYQSDGLLYAFINEASGNISQFSWTFGDGNSSTDVNPFYTYSQPGEYEVCQEVAGLCGNNQTCQTITVSCAAPQAAFNYNADELQVSFQDLSSNQPSVWNWTFGDGSSSTQQSPQHTYTAPGTYQVCLESGSVCGTTQSCQTITLGCAAPVAAFNFQANQLQLAFTDNSANQPTQWSWTFGDGGSSTAQNPQHTYALPGTYQVCLTATSACGASQECEFIEVTCNAPQAAFSFVANGLQLNFQDNSAGAPTQWSWTFGDGGASTLQNPQHAFSLPGVYEVCLTATSPCGSTQSCQTISVSCLAPQAAFNFQTSGLTVSFTDNSGNLPTGWMWTFGDGASSTAQNPQHAYAAPGAFTVCLQASSVCGSTQTCQTVNVACAAPLADFDYTADQLAVSFEDVSTNNPTEWLWTFGDGASSTEQNPQHLYSLPGNYTVCLQVSSICGGSQRCEQISVTCLPPAAVIAYQQSELTFQFLDHSTNNPTQWSWTFGDGSASTDQNPQHTYAEPGSYEICLTVASPCGDNQTCLTIDVVCEGPAAAFSVSSLGELTAFSDASTNNPTSWFWDFGDGNTSTSQNPLHTFQGGNTFTVCLTVSNICGADTNCQVIVLTNVAGADLPGADMRVFPNPTRDFVRLELVNLDGERVHLTILNIAGQAITHFDWTITGAEATRSIDLSGLPAGMYYLALDTDRGRIARKLAVEGE